MRKSRFTTEQIISILQEHAAGAAVAELLRRHNISRPTLYAWKKQYGNLQVPDAKRLKQLEEENRRLKQYGNLQVPDAKRLKQLEEENRRLKRLVADQALNLQVLKDVLGNGA